jgi:hypothetical protein
MSKTTFSPPPCGDPDEHDTLAFTGVELAECYSKLFWLMLLLMFDIRAGSFSCLHFVNYGLLASALRPLAWRNRRFMICRRLCFGLMLMVALLPFLPAPVWLGVGNVIGGGLHLAFIWCLLDTVARDFDARGMPDLAHSARARRFWYCVLPLVSMPCYFLLPQKQWFVIAMITLAVAYMVVEVLVLSFFRRARLSLLSL